MKNILILIILSLLNFKLFAQDVYLETFDSKKSIGGWKINSKGEVAINNHYTFNGKTFYKEKKDSFLIITDTSNNTQFKVILSKKFKAIPSNKITLYHSLFSNDSLNDFISYSIRFLDKSKKSIFDISFFSYSGYDPGFVIGITAYVLPEKNDTIWQKTDSIEISYSFYPYDHLKKVKRFLVFDGISLSGIYASTFAPQRSSFEIYPNPASDVLKFKYESFLKPKKIQLFDYTGRLVMANKGEDELNVESLKSGLYFVTILFDNGTQATQKVEIK
jgi:hypothetical protein